jgi:predicted lipid-binding transport protein (Tim44 family)
MRTEETFLLRLAIRIGLLLLLIAGAAGGQAYNGSRPLWFAVAAGIVVVLLMCARVTALRGGGKPPSALVADTARRGGRRVKRLVDAVAGSVHAVRRRGRVRRVERAAVDAAESDALLSPDSVRSSAEALFRLVQLAWDARDCGRLSTLLGPELLAEWEQDLAQLERSGRRERLEVAGDVRVEYIGLTTAERGAGPRVVLLIEALLRTYTEGDRGRRTDGDTRRLCQYWTLGLRDGLWTVLKIEDRAQGKHHLAEPIDTPSGAAR